MNLVLLSLLAACGGSDAPTTPPMADAAKTEAHEAHDGHDMKDEAVAAPFEGLSAGEHKVFFVSPADGSTVTSPVKVAFGVQNLTVEPAGNVKADAGHHHIIVDGAPIDAGATVPSDETHIHFGKGQTTTSLPLEPGEHTLTMQFADGLHRSYGPDASATITVTVEAPAAE